jgi:hypothetical protein
LPAKEILSRLHTQSDPWISLIRDAEVIVILGSPAGLEVVKGGDCVTSNKPPTQVGPHAWPKCIAALKGIYKRIFEIREGAPVILRTYTYYVPVLFHAPADFPGVTSWDEAGIFDVCTTKFEWHAQAIRQAAAAYKVPVADVFTAFNGKAHREDPVAEGFSQLGRSRAGQQPALDYRSTRMTTRRSVGRLTSLNPAASKTLRLPTCSSPHVTSCPGCTSMA